MTSDWGISIYVSGVGALLAIIGGVTLRQSITSNDKKCPDCAEMIRNDSKVCMHCGFRFSPEDLTPTGTAYESLSTVQIAAMRRIKCFQCRTGKRCPRTPPLRRASTALHE